MTAAAAPARSSIARKPALVLLGALFAVTGCAGLLAEQCYEKLLVHLVGASTPAAALVLAAYFLGLTLGALLYARVAAGRRAPLALYAGLELFVGSWSLLLAAGAGPILDGLSPVLRLGRDHFAVLQGLRFAAACLCILPPTMAMGATFPAVVDALEGLRVPQPRKAMARFYTLNLIGAVVGALLGPYLLFPRLGLSNTLLATFAADALAAAAALWLSRRAGALASPVPMAADSIDSNRAAVPVGAAAVRARLPILLAACGFGSGFLAFALEVEWTHLIGAVLGNSVYAFAAMLALVLLGLAIGGAISSRILGGSGEGDERTVSAAVPGGLLVGVGLLLAFQSAHWPWVPTFFIAHGEWANQFWRGEALRWLQAGVQLLPVTTVLGMVYPLLFRLDLFPPSGRASAAARLLALNSLGCVLGALCCGFFLLPQLGSEATLRGLGLAAVAAGLLLALAHSKGKQRLVPSILAATAVAVWFAQGPWNRLALTNGGHVYFAVGHVSDDSKLIYFQEDSSGGITTVVETPDGSGAATRTLLTNGKFQANDSGEASAQSGIALVPIVYARGLGDALVIGLGSGHTAGVVGEAGFGRIDIAEIAPGMVDAARKYFGPLNRQILDDPRSRIRLEDGRNFLLLEDQRKFDLIGVEISSLWYAGACNLYSREFYRLARSRLKPGGVLQQWVQIHHITLEEIGAVIATMRDTFPFVSFWVVGGQGVVLGSESPQRVEGAAIEAFLRAPDDLRAARIDTLVDTLSSRLLAPAEVDRMLADRRFTINTDSNRWLEAATPVYNLVPRDFERENLDALAKWSTFSTPELGASLPAELVTRIGGITPDGVQVALGLLEPAEPEAAAEAEDEPGEEQ